MYVCTYVCTCTNIECMHHKPFTDTRVSLCVCVRACAGACVWVMGRLRVSACVCLYIHMYIRMCVCSYVHTYSSAQK